MDHTGVRLAPTRTTRVDQCKAIAATVLQLEEAAGTVGGRQQTMNAWGGFTVHTHAYTYAPAGPISLPCVCIYTGTPY